MPGGVSSMYITQSISGPSLPHLILTSSLLALHTHIQTLGAAARNYGRTFTKFPINFKASIALSSDRKINYHCGSRGSREKII
jgi:hypothetical protein